MTRSGEVSDQVLQEIEDEFATLLTERQDIEALIPGNWETMHETYRNLADEVKKARRSYRRNVDSAYEPIPKLYELIRTTAALESLGTKLTGLEIVIRTQTPTEAMATIKNFEKELGTVAGSSSIKSRVSKARRALKGSKADPAKAQAFLAEGIELYAAELAWRQRAVKDLSSPLGTYNDALRSSIGLRLQDKLTIEQAKLVSRCKSHHQDISLAF